MTEVTTEGHGPARLTPGQWHRMVSSVFGDVNLKLGDEALFSGAIERASFDAIDVAEASSACEDAVRTGQHVASDKRESYVLVMPLGGRLQISQRGHSCEIDSRHFALFDLNAPHRYTHAGRLDVLSLRAPARMFRESVRGVDDMVATALPAGDGVASITREFVRSILRETPRLNARASATLGVRVAEMAALMLDGAACAEGGAGGIPEHSTSMRHAIYLRCLRIIDARLHEPELKPEIVARACGISTRYLHRVFQDSDETLAEYIRHRRLDRCRQRLELARDEVQIKEIALSGGWKSISHFSNAFKARFGVRPSDVRGRATRPVSSSHG